MDKKIDSGKNLYLKYFPIHNEDKERLLDGNAKAVEEGAESDENIEKAAGVNTDKNCVYCGNIQLRPYAEDNYLICDDCRLQFVRSKQEFTAVLFQVKRSLELLMDVSFAQSFALVCTNNWLQKCKSYFGRGQEEWDSFGKDFITKKETHTEITFFVHKEMPRSTYIYITSGYIIGEFLKQRVSGLSETKTYYAMMKWCGLWYMYLIGYTDFCRWKARAELYDEEYKKWVEKLGTPLDNQRGGISVLIDMLKKTMEEKKKEIGEE